MRISVVADLALYLAVGGLASVELSCSLSGLNASSTSGTDSSAAHPYCVWSFSRSLSVSQARCCRLEICNIVPGDYAASVDCSCCLLEVGCRHVLDLAVSHRLDLYHLGTCRVATVFCATVIKLLKLFVITLTRRFQGVRIPPWHISLVELDMQIRLLFSLKSLAPCATERQCLFPKAETQSCWRNENRASKLLSHDLAACFDPVAAGLIAIFVRDLGIAYVHDLLRMNELFRFKCLSQSVTMHVCGIGCPTQIHLLGTPFSNSFCA